MFRKKKVGFVSKIDQFLAEFDRTHSKSDSQQAEIKKFEEIHHKRDVAEDNKEIAS